jgi:putative glycosyltransferase (TIGR04372 family)
MGGEVRDAAIESYKSTCELVNELGGQVVRMGGNNFPKLINNFPAIDYAHSVIKSEELDYWLWANCKFWVGNANGASVAVIPFGKPRLLTNLWPFHASGPPTDFCLPKLVYNQSIGELVPIDQIVSMKLSRNMKKELFSQSGLIVIENPPELLRIATLELYESLNKERSKIISTFESEIYKAMNLSPITPKMKIPQSYNDFLLKMQTTKFYFN